MAANTKSIGITVGVVAVGVILLFLGFGKSCGKSTHSGNSGTASGATTIRIETVITTPTEKESITIKNTGNEDIDLKGWSLGDKNDPDARGLDDILKAGKTRRYDKESLGFGINDKNEIIYLKRNGNIIDKWEGK